ncbi:thiol reductant ABC exporter subunit CydD [Lentzea flaviverrucosa]|uniref:ATP-binding cassette, subfamily C, CydCD n=1 Tax=Lentzea flaviverrucosa TaxID=200379 RepID=A0A1H9XV82_9PSEU|nr:thiol reductant ABC exporter subunit CydD [Lentzea flaviverrucosa]RDI18718.1 ATP-binding cassette subfamily C protein CydCD [Lentzea flaviverrucosa]SES50021.1 ATP-binding cassette, subfamily C, CydCD [Lentzea flaviverrucosa]
MKRGPLGALPQLSRNARRALVGVGALAFLNALALVAQAVALASVITTREGLPLLAVAILARAGLSWATESAAARAAAGAKEELRTQLLAKSFERGPGWIADRGTAELSVLATKGLDALDAYFTRYLPALVTAVIVPPLAGAWILFTDWPSAVLIAVTVPLIPVFAALIGWYTEKRVRKAADVTELLSAQLMELLRALPVLTVFGRAKQQAGAVEQIGEQHRKATMGTLRIAFLSALVLEIAASLSVALIAVGVGIRLVHGDMTLMTALVVLILAPECYLPLRAAGAAHHASEDGLEAVRRVAEVVEHEDKARPRLPGGSVHVDNLRVLRRGGFAPDGISFDVRPGEIHRLEGASGAGKSTTFQVLLGFVEPTDGTAFVAGDIAYVPQKPAFAAATPRAELELTVPGADDVEQIADEVAALHLLDRQITDLSTGERQRVAVARALLRVRHGATVLLLDEPTAHLDPVTSRKVDKAIKRASDTAAVVLASHREKEATEDETAARVVTEETQAERPKRLPIPWKGAGLGILAAVAGIALTALAAHLIARAAEMPPILTLSVLVVGVRTFALSKGVLRYVERLVTHDETFRLANGLRAELWLRLVRTQRRDGLQRLVEDTDTVRDLVPRVLVPPIVAIGAGVATTVLFAFIDPAAALTLGGLLLAAGLAAPAVAVWMERRASTKLARGRRKVARDTINALVAAPDLIAHDAHHRLLTQLHAEDVELAGQTRRQAFGTGAATAIVLLATGAAALICATTGNPVLGLVPLALAEPLAALPLAAQQRRALREASARLQFDAPERPEQPRGKRIRLENVDVRWPGATEPTLRDLHLDVEPGTHVAIVGPSGSGKSTLFALLLGFLQPERGIVELPRATWCPQEPMLVSTTVRENLRMSGQHDDEALREALRKACLPEWTDRLDTVIRPDQVSGGEAQRLALARALLHDADVVLLDEPTAHLDEPTARRLLDQLRQDGRTVLHITHRPDEAARADLVLDLGTPAYR